MDGAQRDATADGARQDAALCVAQVACDHPAPIDAICADLGDRAAADIAAAAGMSTSPCWRRIKLLKERGVIKGETVLVDVPGRLTLDEAGVARRAVLEGAGIGIFLEQSVADDLAAGRMIRCLEDWTPPRSELCLYYPGRRHPSAGVAAFLALAREG